MNTVKLFKDIFDRVGYRPKPAPGTSFFNDQLVPISFTPSNRGYKGMQDAIGDKFRWAPMGYPLPPNARKGARCDGRGRWHGPGDLQDRRAQGRAWDWINFARRPIRKPTLVETTTPARNDMGDHPYLEEGIRSTNKR